MLSGLASKQMAVSDTRAMDLGIKYPQIEQEVRHSSLTKSRKRRNQLSS